MRQQSYPRINVLVLALYLGLLSSLLVVCGLPTWLQLGACHREAGHCFRPSQILWDAAVSVSASPYFPLFWQLSPDFVLLLAASQQFS